MAEDRGRSRFVRARSGVRRFGVSLFPALLLVAGAGIAPAFAADAASATSMPVLAPRTPPDMPERSTPVHVWSGPYAGSFVGYNAARFDNASGSLEGDGLIGGVYAGTNFQTGSYIFGVEGDIGGAGFGLDGEIAGRRLSADTGVFGSLRARAGLAVDPFLAFATAGVAASESRVRLNGASDRETSVGYTVGAGVEARITDDVSGRLEYRYTDYGDETYDLGDRSISSGFDEQSIRAGIQLKF